jgi:transcriptional regulator with XRE-family HTH domain
VTQDQDPQQHPRNISAIAAGLPERLRARRMAAGLSRTELAARSGVSYKSVCDIEKGRRARVQEKTVMLLAAGLGCEVGELVDLPAVPPRTEPPSPRVRWTRLALITAAAVTLTIAAAAWFAVSRATWEIVEGDLIMRDALLQLVMWRIDEHPDVRVVLELPTDRSLIVGFNGEARDGAQAWRVSRVSGHRLASYALDEHVVREAFGAEILSEGQDFSCSKLRLMELDGDPSTELVVQTTHGKYYPAGVAVYELDGTPRGQYVNRGHLAALHIEDLDDDGRDEVLALGTNNDPAYQGATVIYLEDGAWSGAAVDRDGPGRGPVGAAHDGARYRLVLPSFGREVMERFERVRLLAFAPRTHELDDGEERIVFTAGVTAGGVSVVCDGQLRPLLVTATDALVGVVRAWDDWPESPETFPGQAWLDDWLAGARWSELTPESVSDGPVAGR